MILRPAYMEQLKTYRDVPLVKILAGIRRCGKSTLLAMLREELLAAGVDDDHIIAVNYATSALDETISAQEMVDRLRAEIRDGERYYLLLDEVQEVEGWEKAVNSLLEQEKTDIYVTGSNSKLLAAEISTYLTGRYVSIPVYPLSFREYISFREPTTCSTTELFESYLRQGGFPVVAAGNFEDSAAYQIVEGIYASVVSVDIARRYQVKNRELFDRVVRFILENVGKTFSANAIVGFLKSEGRSLSAEAIYNYLNWLEKAFVIYRCGRYDLQGKAVLKTQEKFYLADPSLKYALLGFDPRSVAAMLENVVYFELRRRGYEVYVGKNEAKEIDFVATCRDQRLYVQVCRELPENSDRELANLLAIADNYPKYVVTLSTLATGNVQGIEIIPITEFLLRNDL